MFDRLKDLIDELKRRRVFRVAVVYSGTAFIIFQIIDATFDILGIPNWLGKYTIILLILGFPVATALAWAFDITEKGVVRTRNKPAELKSRKPFVGNTSLSIIAALAILLAVWGWWGPEKEPIPDYRSIAVLPLDNYMGDVSQDYFVDGMTESIISELARLEGLRVISRTSAMRFRNSELSIPEIAATLGVDAIIEGSVLKAENTVRITAQLIDGHSDEHLWAKTFDRTLDQILNLQRDVARAIATEIKWTLDPEDEEYFNQLQEINSDAYQQYMMGWYFRTKETQEGLAKAYNHFQEALKLDPDLVQAHAALVVTLFLGAGTDSLEFGVSAKIAAERAMALDPNSAEANLAMALYRQLFELDFKGAEQSFKRAIDLRPGDAEARREFGLFLLRMGRFQEAKMQLEIGYSYDPMSALVVRDLGYVNLRRGNMQKGLYFVEMSLELDPENRRAAEFLGLAYLAINEPEKAYQHYLMLRKKYGGSYFFGEWLAYVRSGRTIELAAEMDSLKNSDGFSDWGEYPRAMMATIQGRHDDAIGHFQKLVDENATALVLVIEETVFDGLHDIPEFKSILKQAGYPDIEVESFSAMLNRLYGPPPISR